MPVGPSARARGAAYRVYTLLAAVVLAAYFGVLSDGVRHDDHLHRANLRSMGWNWHDLIESTTFAFPGRQMHFWWQSEPVQWRYPRPVTMAILKAELLIAGERPFAMHTFSLLWHWQNCVLVFHLASWTLRSQAWAALAAVLFALCPNAAMAVGWTAAHNVLISNAFLLLALLFYIRASFDGGQPRGAMRWLPLAGALSFWTLAMLSRESAIAFPALVFALDGVFGGRAALRRRWPVYAVLAAMALAYVGWRFLIFAQGGMPSGYMSVPTGVGYPLWLVSKLVQAVVVLLLHLPLYTPIDYVGLWTTGLVLTQCILTVVLIGAALHFGRATRGQPGRWFGPLWLVIGLAPVLPIQLMPHFAYLPFVGWALTAVAFLRSAAPHRRTAFVVATLAAVGGMLAFQRVVDRAQVRAEQLVFADVLQSSPPASGGRLFFINLPLPASFVVYAARESWGREDLTGYALTLADSTHRVSRPTRIDRTGDRTIELSCEPPGWFESNLDRWFLKLTGRREPFSGGEVSRGDLFDTTVLETSGGGVTRLRFDFHEPIDREDWLFFVATPERPMQRLRLAPAGVEPGDATATAVFRERYARWFMERDLLLVIRARVMSWFGARPTPSTGDK